MTEKASEASQENRLDLEIMFKFKDGTGRRIWVTNTKDFDKTLEFFDCSMTMLRREFVSFYKKRLEQ